jgi:hypothetical protein
MLNLLSLSSLCYASLYQFAYCSTSAIYDPPPHILQDIISVARERNERDGITGILLAKDNSYLQIIEGEEMILKDTVFRILRDARHKHIVVLYNVAIDQRDFSAWHLALRTPIFSPVIKKRFEANNFNDYVTDPIGIPSKLSKRAQTLLTVFEEHM